MAEMQFDEKVSILALREKGDDSGRLRGDRILTFQSSPFVRRATRCTYKQLEHLIDVSILALREKGDVSLVLIDRATGESFNPRPS